GRVGVDDGPHVGALGIDHAMQGDLRGGAPGARRAVAVEADELLRLQLSLARAARRDQRSAIVQKRGNVAIRRGQNPFLIEPPRDATNGLFEFVLVHRTEGRGGSYRVASSWGSRDLYPGDSLPSSRWGMTAGLRARSRRSSRSR